MYWEVCLVITALAYATSAFFVFPEDVNATALTEAYGIDSVCFAALNSSIDCNPGTVSKVHIPDDIYWTTDNITALCTSRCRESIGRWVSTANAACEGQSMAIGGMVMSARYLPLVYQHGYDVTCLSSRYGVHFQPTENPRVKSNQVSSDGGNCLQQSYGWQGSYAARYPEDYCSNGDMNPPECSDESFDPSEITMEDRSITNLYPQSLICSDCFLHLWRLRLENPLLGRNNSYASYLETQYDNIQSVCSTTVPATIPQQTIVRGTQTIPSGAPSPTPEPCNGQKVYAPSTQSCKSLAASYNVPLAAAYAATGGLEGDCTISENYICLPNACKLLTLDMPDVWDVTW